MQEAEEQVTLEEERRREEKQRVLIQRLQELEMRQAANNLKVNVYNVFNKEGLICVIFLCSFSIMPFTYL